MNPLRSLLRPVRAAVCARLCRGVATPGLGYIDACQTVGAAAAAGLSVGDYVEALWSQAGGSQRVIDQEFFNTFGAGQSHYLCFRKVTSVGTG